MEDGLYYVSKRIESTEKTLQFDVELSQVKNDQNKLHAKITRFEKLMWNELEGMQNEYRSGEVDFQTYMHLCVCMCVIKPHKFVILQIIKSYNKEEN